jgi:hypothetical protein
MRLAGSTLASDPEASWVTAGLDPVRRIHQCEAQGVEKLIENDHSYDYFRIPLASRDDRGICTKAKVCMPNFDLGLEKLTETILKVGEVKTYSERIGSRVRCSR